METTLPTTSLEVAHAEATCLLPPQRLLTQELFLFFIGSQP